MVQARKDRQTSDSQSDRNRAVRLQWLGFLTIVATIFSTGCATSISSGPTPESTQGDAGTVYICRPSKVMRLMDAPELKINDSIVAKISPGTLVSHGINVGDSLSIDIKASALLMRDEQLIYADTVDQSGDLYLLLRGKADRFSGAIPAAIQSLAEKGKFDGYNETKDWAIRELPPKELSEICDLFQM